MPYNSEPVRWDWSLVAGDTAQPASVVLLDGDDAPYDLTGVVGECQIRTEPGGSIVLEPVVAVVGDAEDGEFTFSAPASETEGLKAGAYKYAVRLAWPDDTVRTVLEGVVTVKPSVVR